MRILTKTLASLVLLLLPSAVFAQGSLTGTVRDTSGAVLPGVTVEATSPALIEKSRAATTDASGQYRIIDLQPGTYTLTVTLPGFATVKRENLELAGSQVMTIPIEMRVGALEETVTVSGASPVVDMQSAKREIVMNNDMIQALPVARAAGALLNATPGLFVDTNGPALSPTMTFFNARSSTNNSTSVAGEGRMTVNGMTVAAARSGGVSSYVYDTTNAQEVSVVVGGGLGESDIGGPVMNLVPKSGGNTFAGNVFFNGAGTWSKGDNLDDSLRAIGLTQTPGIIKAYDASGSYGGPIKKDRLWFFATYRKLDTQTAMEGINANANAGNAARWDWVGSPIPARLVQDRQMLIGRLTGQTGKHRLTFNSEYQKRCEGTPLNVETQGCHNRDADWIGLGNNAAPFQSPEATSTAARGYFDVPFYLNQGSWTMVANSKLLLEAGYTAFRYNPIFGHPPPDGITNLIAVNEQSNAINTATGLRYAPQANYLYRGVESWGWAVGKTDGWQVTASYVTGAHNMKAGYQGNRLDQLDQTISNSPLLSYRFNQGVPNAVSYRLPDFGRRTITSLAGLFIQDSYTRGKLTLQGALRYDRAASYAPVEQNGTTTTSFLNPQAITIQRTAGVDAFNDITPRVGVAYDVFGNGKTALKFNWGRYLAYAANDAPYTSTNPGFTLVREVTNRQWTDGNNNKVVDCDLLNMATNGTGGDTCAAVTGNQANFGKAGTATIVNPDVLSGWGVRPNDDQATFTLQHELRPRLSVDASYTYRRFHNFFVTDDLTRPGATGFYETYSLSAPSDPRLPNGGGYPITVYVPTTAAAAIPAKTYLTKETDFGPERDSHWAGFDLGLNARLRQGLTASIGTTTGRSVVNTCGTATKYNQVNAATNVSAGPDPRGCNNVDPYQTTLRGLATYTIPKIDVLVSATLRSQPPVTLGTLTASAAWIVPNSLVVAAFGKLPPGATATGTTTIQISDNEHRIYADTRRTQIDMRFAKIVRFRHTRSDVGIDLNNLTNTNYPTGYSTNYTYSAGNTQNGGTWANPTSIYTARFVRLNYTLNF